MAAAAGGASRSGSSSSCDFCEEAKALVYCRADSARLCLACDRRVHAANAVCSRHPRSLLCDACLSAPSAFLVGSSPSRRRGGGGGHPRLLCPNCDFDAVHGQGGGGRARERRPVEPYSGCPTVAEMLSLLGVPVEDEKSVLLGAGGPDGWLDGGGGGGAEGGTSLLMEEEGWVWETPPILSMEDLIVPINPYHGFRALGVPPPPKDRNASCGKHKDEILRQLRELVKSDVCVNNDCGLLEAETGLGSPRGLQVGEMISNAENDAALVVAPSPEAKILRKDCCEMNGVLPFSSEHQFETCMEGGNASLDGPMDAHGSVSDTGRHLMSREELPSLPPKCTYQLSGLDRGIVLSRYKEKRKTRRYDKQIRYESRKVRADSRMRIKGRFAKVN
uniref:Zinc finger protein CONSTANS-LIKE 13 n=1 Tax=Anthurium amnicola TaxID=1678845 RepID=A0A1D1ZCH4_9ARAE